MFLLISVMLLLLLCILFYEGGPNENLTIFFISQFVEHKRYTMTAGHSSNHGYHCCQLTRQSSCVSNFYCTFEVFIWLSLVIMRFFLTTFHFIWGKGICQWFPLTTNMYSMSLILSRCATNYDEFTCHLNVYLAQYSLLVTYVNIMQALKRSFGSTCHKQSLIFYSK